ncbi:MAG: EAL domain-containing protein [Rhodoferax sp.]|nr:EAL domain-containing protein [Rhodoferax sp.]
MIEREAFNKKSGKSSHEIALGSPVGRRMKRRPSDCWPSIAATGASSVHYIIDWNYDEDRSRIRAGNGPEKHHSPTPLRYRLAKSIQKPTQTIASLMRDLSFAPPCLRSASPDQKFGSRLRLIGEQIYRDVIAEGVETQEQLQLLISSGCVHHQGYLFGKPVPIEQFEASLQQ